MAQKVLELGQGLEIWYCHLDELREQDVNAQVMPPEMFERLTATVKKDGRMESLPFCALVEYGGRQSLEIVSGHHRTRSARAAGLTHIHAIVDVTGLDRDAIAAKQLAHNAIHGEPDAQLLKKIYESIRDVDRRIEAFVDPAKINIKVEKVAVGNLSLDLSYRTALILFLPYHRDKFERAAEEALKAAGPSVEVIYLAERKLMEKFKAVMKRVQREYDIKAMGTALAELCGLALKQLGVPEEDADKPCPDDAVALRDVFGASLVPPDLASRLNSAVDDLVKRGQVPAKERWRAIPILCGLEA